MKIIKCSGQTVQCPCGEDLRIMRHTAAHVMAQAVKRLYPQAIFAYGPPTENGFYYDIDLGDVKLSESDFKTIEMEMQNIIKENLPLKPFTLSREEAVKFMLERGEKYKVEHIGDLAADEGVSFYRQGEYVDMCRGPHLVSTGAVKSFRLLNISGAYWKNDSSNKMLTRINAVAFLSEAELDRFMTLLEEAKKRDHRKIGSQMQLFMFSEDGVGFPFFLPKGMIIKNELINYWRTVHQKSGYNEISSPMIMHRRLWETSGHWEHYKDNMYCTQIDGEDFCVKPMNCPGSILVYNSRPRSYRELPLRIAELGTVHRHELRGALQGLFRVRCFTQDDAHIFITRDQITDEIVKVVNLIDEVYSVFGFEYTVELSTRPENSMGSDEDWQAATDGLAAALDKLSLAYTINEGDGAFYGPKIDFHLRDSIGRTWQCGTIQLDFQLPLNFDLCYTDENDRRQRPIMIHRVCFGSIERFIGILTEHFAGKFPVFLSPVQVRILQISEKNSEYAQSICDKLRGKNIRCELDNRNEKIGYMIRQAQLVDRIPFMVIVGQKEEEQNTVSVRELDCAQTRTMSCDELVSMVKERVDCMN
ncbi:MAG: threonine--tRNA ligase [Ruminococcaceae bacterium]|nr:threonine--tRNA ligase [Oscillospiraceae bacterium]